MLGLEWQLRRGIISGLYEVALKEKWKIKLLKDELYFGRSGPVDVEQMENEKKYERVPGYKIYITEIPNAYISGGSDVVRVNAKLLWDRCIYDDMYYRYCPDVLLRCGQRKVIYRQWNTKDKYECGIYLVKMWSNNWFHFFIECISKLQMIDMFPEYDNIPILIDEDVFFDERNIDLIKFFNKKNRDIIKVKKNRGYHIKKLIYPSQCSWLIFDKKSYLKRTGWAIDKTHLENIRNSFIEEYKAFDRNIKRKIFLARGNNDRVINEDLIARELKKHDFDIVNTANMTLEEEIELFMNASVIVSVIGAGLTNMIFASKDVKIIELCPFKFSYDSYAMMADPLGIEDYHIIDLEIIQDGNQINKTKLRLNETKLDKVIELSGGYNAS